MVPGREYLLRVTSCGLRGEKQIHPKAWVLCSKPYTYIYLQ